MSGNKKFLLTFEVQTAALTSRVWNTHTHTLTLSLSLIHTHTRIHSIPLSLTRSNTHITRAQAYTCTYNHTQTHTHTHTHTHAQTHTLTHALTHALTHTHSPTRTALTCVTWSCLNAFKYYILRRDWCDDDFFLFLSHFQI